MKFNVRDANNIKQKRIINPIHAKNIYTIDSINNHNWISFIQLKVVSTMISNKIMIILILIKFINKKRK